MMGNVLHYRALLLSKLSLLEGIVSVSLIRVARFIMGALMAESRGNLHNGGSRHAELP